jgi:nucleoside-diphosphate-sugar epimerase
MSFFNAFGLPLTIARPFNTYGPRQSARAVIPAIITQIGSGVREIKLGDVSPTRDFNYVADVCRGFMELANCDNAVGEVVNIGSDSEISVRDTLETIKGIMHSDVVFILDEQRLRPENSEVFRLRCDSTKIRRLTGYEPKYSLEEGLTRTIEWFTEPRNLAKYKPGMYNI